MNEDAHVGDGDDAALPPVIVEEHGDGLSVVRLNRPAQRNPLSVSTLELLDAIVSALISRAETHAIIFTGTADVFASGADIRELSALTPATAREFAARGQRLFRKISDARLLTVAAVNGYCMGGGLDLALSCHLRVASSGAVFAHPGARLGIITGWGGTQRLTRLVGSARAVEMFTTARRVGAPEAFEMGLVERLADLPLACALDIAARRSAAHHPSA
ncbi:MAG TPA: enoyl-CoA hydratase/isomerase family protein [Pyrinomonadaceae bacterium]|nr:enoyl-CoA hydratase/isomerase family protein [Pyrinomonadaceae bacterium]